MANAKGKEITGVAAIASECGSGLNCHIILPRSFLGKRVFAILKEQWDQMRREQERQNTRTVGTFASALVNAGGGEFSSQARIYLCLNLSWTIPCLTSTASGQMI